MNGIIMVAFGEQYDHLAAHTVAFSRRFTQLPIVVLSNLKHRSPKWATLKDVSFIELPWRQNENRSAKTSIISFSSFDKTLYLDCDAIVQRPGLEKVFTLIEKGRLLLNVYSRWIKPAQATSLYSKAMRTAGVALPVTVYYGAFLGFDKSAETWSFFKRWNRYWQMNGCGREMPALACAVKNSGIPVRELSRKDGYFSWPINKNVIIQHEYGSYVRRLVGCPEFKSYKPFDGRQQ